jgi:hypothetical protein
MAGEGASSGAVHASGGLFLKSKSLHGEFAALGQKPGFLCTFPSRPFLIHIHQISFWAWPWESLLLAHISHCSLFSVIFSFFFFFLQKLLKRTNFKFKLTSFGVFELSNPGV